MSTRVPAFVQIAAVVTRSGTTTLYGLDKKGRVWRKFGGDAWYRVSDAAWETPR